MKYKAGMLLHVINDNETTFILIERKEEKSFDDIDRWLILERRGVRSLSEWYFNKFCEVVE